MFTENLLSVLTKKVISVIKGAPQKLTYIFEAFADMCSLFAILLWIAKRMSNINK